MASRPFLAALFNLISMIATGNPFFLAISYAVNPDEKSVKYFAKFS